jgi:hypothetical protein
VGRVCGEVRVDGGVSVGGVGWGKRGRGGRTVGVMDM